MIEVKNLSVSLKEFSLENISFQVKPGEYFVLLGPSGAGKTILLESVTGLVPIKQGKIFLEGRDITCEKIQNRGVGLVYQDKTLFPHLRVEKNILYAMGDKKVKYKEKKKWAKEMAGRVGAGHLLNRYPETLSGGEYQRVSLARTISRNPRCLLLDEPLSSLDAIGKKEMRALLRKINAGGLTIIHVTHDYEEAVALADRVAVIEGGKILQTGTPDEIFHFPKSEFVAGFTGVRNFLKGILDTGGTGAASKFISHGKIFYIQTSGAPGTGYLMIRSHDIILSHERQDTSARNNFKGEITDIVPTVSGIEVVVDIGVELSALITRESLNRLGLKPGVQIWISFKANAGNFFNE